MLPENDTAWPPAIEQAEKLTEHSAWYSGDPDQLATFYGPRTGVANHPNQFRGGMVGRVARWFWGMPTPAGESRSKLHVPLAADICATSSDLLFSEPVQLTSKEAKVAETLAALQAAGLDATLAEAAEVAAAYRGVYLRTVWDKSVSPLPWTEAHTPDGAIPEWTGKRLKAVTLWSELPHTRGDLVHRLLERHEVGSIEYALFAGTNSNLGRRVPLTEHPGSADLAELVNAEGLQPTGISRLTVTYVPNIKPDRLNPSSPEGRSDLQGLEPLLDALDEAYTSWFRDIRHAKSRLHVPRSYIESADGPGSSGIADVDREVYVAVDGVLATGKDGLLIDAQQFAIRVAEHSQTCREWTETIIESAGYTPPSKSGDQGGAVTATEVNSKDRRSNMTRGKKVRYWTLALVEHLRTQIDIANAQLAAGITTGPFGADLSVEFSDGVQESALNLANTVLAMRNAESASAETRVRILHPDWDDVAVGNEVARILAETGGGEPLPVPDDAGL